MSAYAANHVLPDQSASGIRTRRNELVELGVIRDSGKREKLRSGRYGVVWEVVPENEREAPRRIKIKRDPKDVLAQVISLLDQVEETADLPRNRGDRYFAGVVNLSTEIKKIVQGDG